MATWAEFAKAAAEMAELGLAQLRKFELAYLATTARDGRPRVHPVCPFIAEGRLFIAVGPSSPKRLDLVRDGRYALHMLPGKRDDEFYLTGRARRVTDAVTRQRALAGKGNINISEDEWLFEFDVERVMTAYWEKVGQPGTYAVRQFWREADGVR